MMYNYATHNYILRNTQLRLLHGSPLRQKFVLEFSGVLLSRVGVAQTGPVVGIDGEVESAVMW